MGKPDHRGYFLARWASAMALAGEPDAAADMGLKVAQVAAAVASKRTTRELMRCSRRWSHGTIDRDRGLCGRQ